MPIAHIKHSIYHYLKLWHHQLMHGGHLAAPFCTKMIHQKSTEKLCPKLRCFYTPCALVRFRSLSRRVSGT